MTFITAPVLAFTAPLGADSAAVCAAMGARSRIVITRRIVIAATLTAFEAGMPIVGMAASGPVGAVIGPWSDYLAAALLAALGIYFLTHGDEDEDEASSGIGVAALLALGVAVSVDEIAVGVSLGLAGVHVLPLVTTVGVWVFLATMTGLTFGAKLGTRFRDHAGTFAAAALIVLGALIALGIL